MTAIENTIDTATLWARYQQAQRMLQGEGAKPLVANEAVMAHWLDRGPARPSEGFWYLRESRRNDSGKPIAKSFQWVDANTATQGQAFDHQALAQALSTAAAQSVDPQDLPLADITMQLDEQSPSPQIASLQFTALEQRWDYCCASQCCRAIEPVAQTGDGLVSPDGKQLAFVREYNLWLRN
ncbi:DPP IV N-terminal domain-containing protein, partial [Porticoccaceae bacterium]|nr:DPP IV N-terminal domain-containing protein [Porticoccaceae bacterium]